LCGENILTEWSGKTSNDCFMIDNIEKEIIFKVRFIRDHEKEVVIDNLTGLIWQDNSEAISTRKRWLTNSTFKARRYFDTSGDTAMTYCENLALGGYNDWRLANRHDNEISILSVPLHSPRGWPHHRWYYPRGHSSMKMLAFKYAKQGPYWTSDTSLKGDMVAWHVHYKSSWSFADYNAKNYARYVRCVRGGK
jgi:hypothetical protein